MSHLSVSVVFVACLGDISKPMHAILFDANKHRKWSQKNLIFYSICNHLQLSEKLQVVQMTSANVISTRRKCLRPFVAAPANNNLIYLHTTIIIENLQWIDHISCSIIDFDIKKLVEWSIEDLIDLSQASCTDLSTIIFRIITHNIAIALTIYIIS